MSGDDEIIGPGGSPLERIIGTDNSSADVNIQDQTTPPVDLFFTQALGAPTVLTAATNENDISIFIASVANFAIGNYIGIFSGASGTAGRFFFAQVIGVVGLEVFLDTPLDFAFDIDDPVISTTRDLNVNGSITPQIFSIAGGAAQESPTVVDITRIMVKIITENPPEFSMFGDIIGGLNLGIVLRRNNGVMNNIFNAKTNGDMANLMFDLSFFDQAKVQGVNGIVGRMTFAGQAKHGVAIRLAPGDSLELIIQDDLSQLTSFRIIAQGHIVD